MNTLVRTTLSAILGCMMVSTMSFAETSGHERVGAQCHSEALKLNHLVQSLPRDSCAGDVEIAAAYLDSASMQIRTNHYKEALVSLHYGEHELKSIAYSRAYCANFSQQVKPSVAQVIRFIGEVEALEKIKN